MASLSTTMKDLPVLISCSRAFVVEYVAGLVILLALVSFALVRCEPTDTPYHLATAKWAFLNGSWPVTNLFSYTHPDYPLYQQYPVYQTLLYVVYQWGGWVGLSVFHLLAWLIVFLLWTRWAGPFSWSIRFGLLLVVLLLGLRERMVLRPDILTITYFALMLHLADHLRAGRLWACFTFPFVQWLWVNSHQMFWVGLVIQGSLLLDQAIRFVRRQNMANGWARCGPTLVAGLLSLGACFFSPLGWRVIEVPIQTAGSLFFHRDNVMEFQPFTSSPQATWLVSLSFLLAIASLGLGISRHILFDWLVWLFSLAMVAGAVRGTPFFVAMSMSIAIRSTWRYSRDVIDRPEYPVSPYTLPRYASALLVVVMCVPILVHRWYAPMRLLGGSQPGVGRTLGDWPDDTMDFLRRHPPPGKMMNLSWYLGNPLIWSLFPEQPVFVDPRFEAYPRSFLIDALAAENDKETFDRLMEQYAPGWFVGELRLPGVRRSIASLLHSGEWSLVFHDTVAAVLVRHHSASDKYIAEHKIDLDSLAVPGLLVDQPDLLARQYLRLAAFHADLGREVASRRWRQLAEEIKGQHPHISLTLDSVSGR